MKPSILATGAAGYIEAAIYKHLPAESESVISFVNINEYYNAAPKNSRLETTAQDNCQKQKLDISDQCSITELFTKQKLYKVIHLAAQANDH